MTDSIVSTLSSLVLEQANARAKQRPISYLPDEILSLIFVRYVYEPCEGYAADFMLRRIKAIYLRVYTLIRVCTHWQRVGLACPNLWTVVPIINYEKPKRTLAAPIKLILQRAGGKNLHLAISVDKVPYEQFAILTGHWHRFGVINLWSASFSGIEISDTLSRILEHSSPEMISKLSLHKKYFSEPSKSHPNVIDPGVLLSHFMGSLTTFRTGSIVINWEHMTFSHRLVELRLAHVFLRNPSEIRAFFAALSSASELKKLKLMLVRFDPAVFDRTLPFEVVSLPKLEYLHVERCYWNLLRFVLSHIARGSYHFTLSLHPYTAYRHHRLPNGVDTGILYAFLSSLSIDKLILQGRETDLAPWALPAGLRRLLQSMPDLKTLVLNEFIVTPDLLMALTQPPTSAPHTDKDIFPRLTKLELHKASLAAPLAALKPGFEAVFESHHIQTMVLGGILRSTPQMDGISLDANDEVLRWMRHKVPQFSLSYEPDRAPESWDFWQLWDI